MSGSAPQRIAFFAHERGDARVVKRITAFRDHGFEILGFTFHRDRGKPDLAPDWDNVDLGTTYNRRYFQRLWMLVKSAGILWRRKDRLGDCSLIYAINTDNALIGLFGRFLAGRPVPLVLELADIQPAMTGSGLMARILRAIERFVLSRASLLVTTSPGFIRNYFEPLQKVDGEIFLLENKMFPSTGLPEARVRAAPANGGDPWVIGYFGAFRCRRSLEMIRCLAARLGPKIRFLLRGYPSGTLGGDFDALSSGLPNVVFEGPYTYPEDLAEMYGAVDFNWCFDESDPNGNSAWLLPNRIYEGGCFRVPAVAAKDAETGRWISERGCGWGFPEPFEDTLAEFFESLTLDQWCEMAGGYNGISGEEFRGEGDYAKLAARLKAIGSGKF